MSYETERKVNNQEGRDKGFGSCMKCGDTWNWKRRCQGVLTPLCLQCWDSLTPKDRLPFYMELLDKWISFDKTLEEKIETGGFRKTITEIVLNGG